MGDPTMALGSEDVRRIVDYAKPWLRDAILEMVPRRSGTIDAELLERMVRVEEELKAQRELMAARFDATDQRFAASDKRFEDLQVSLDKRFDAMHSYSDRRFASLQWTILVGLAVVTAAVTVFGLLA